MIRTTTVPALGRRWIPKCPQCRRDQGHYPDHETAELALEAHVAEHRERA